MRISEKVKTCIILILALSFIQGVFAVQDAVFSLRGSFIASSSGDIVTHGLQPVEYAGYLQLANKVGIPPLTNVTVTFLADNITEVDDPDYAQWNRSSAYWVFPLNFTITNTAKKIDWNTDNNPTIYVPLDFSRKLNQTNFSQNGYQLVQCNVTFWDTTNVTVIWGEIDNYRRNEVNVTILNETFKTDLPNSTLFQNNKQYQFTIQNMSEIIIGHPYWFSIVLKIDLIDPTKTVTYKPLCGIHRMTNGLKDVNGANQTITIPVSELPDYVHHASASIYESVNWSYWSHYDNSSILLENSSSGPVVPLPPVADFTGTPTSGTAPLTVRFNDTSTNSPTSWNWSFGDMTWFNTSARSQRNASHTYTNAGTYSVTLQVQNAGGYNSTQKAGYITVTSPTLTGDRIGVFQNGAWYLDANGNGVYDPGVDRAYGFGAPGVLQVTGDWNADGTTKVGFFIGGTWYLDYNGNGVYDAGVDKGYAFGAPGFTPVTGDWNADNKDEIGFFINGSWYLDTSGNGLYDPGIDRVAGLGAFGYTPLVGDWNGDGTDDTGIFINGAWYLDYNDNGVYDPGIDGAYGFGAPGVLPVTGDWNGDGTTKIGFYIDGTWYLDYNGNGVYDPGIDKGYAFGAPGFTPVVGDWNADNKDEIGFFTRGSWYLDYNGNGLYDPGVDKVYGLGAPGYTPLVGKWS